MKKRWRVVGYWDPIFLERPEEFELGTFRWFWRAKLEAIVWLDTYPCRFCKIFDTFKKKEDAL